MTNQIMRRVIRAALEPGRDSRELVLEAGVDIRGLNYAFKAGIHTLYKFKPFLTARDEAHVREILVDNKIYFARADELKDKTELQIRHEIWGDKADPETRRRVVADSERLMRAEVPTIPENSIQASRTSNESLRREFPVFSMAIRNTEPLHWKEYAGDSTGLCIHFDATSYDAASVDSPFSVARLVEYMPARPPIPIPLNIEGTEVARRIALTKPLSYVGEIEYRLVVCKGYSAGIEIVGQKGKFGARHIVGVTIGERMSDMQIAKVAAMAQHRDPAIPLSIARETPTGIRISPFP